MKINPINLNTLSPFVHINPKEIKFKDLMPGYIVKTKRGWTGYAEKNVYIIFDTKQAKQILDYKNTEFLKIKSNYVILRPDKSTKIYIHYNSMDGYEYTWPEYENYESLDITDVWKNTLDMSMFKTKQDIFDFFLVYNIWDF